MLHAFEMLKISTSRNYSQKWNTKIFNLQLLPANVEAKDNRYQNFFPECFTCMCTINGGYHELQISQTKSPDLRNV
jgi:hypothetical protein